MDRTRELAWLYVRGNESIRVTRASPALALEICGPGSEERSQRFDTDASLEAFHERHEQGLIREGWTLQGVVERRAGGDRPKRPERRRKPRPK